MAKVIVFDVNGTLLDLSILDPHFERIFGNAYLRQEWFNTLERNWMADIITNVYTDFNKLAIAALHMTAEKHGVALSGEDETAVAKGMKNMPPFSDVIEALYVLRNGGMRMVTLSNGTLSSTKTLLESTKLEEFFEGIFSVDEVERYKPAAEPYLMVANRLNLPVTALRMVATHAWDIAGAHAAGLSTAFIARPGKVLNPTGTKPDLQSNNLVDLAHQMLRMDSHSL